MAVAGGNGSGVTGWLTGAFMQPGVSSFTEFAGSLNAQLVAFGEPATSVGSGTSSAPARISDVDANGFDPIDLEVAVLDRSRTRRRFRRIPMSELQSLIAK